MFSILSYLTAPWGDFYLEWVCFRPETLRLEVFDNFYIFNFETTKSHEVTNKKASETMISQIMLKVPLSRMQEQ